MIGEAEKFTMQLASKGLNTGLSLGGSNLSDIQANHIKSMFAKKTIIMMDEGINKEVPFSIAEKLKMDRFYKNEVYVVFDDSGLFLPKGSKISPADLERSDLQNLMNNCMYKVS